MYKYVCACCGQEFETSTKGRKYCSHDCYVAARFHKPLSEVKAQKISEGSSPKAPVESSAAKKPSMTEEEFQRELNFTVTMSLMRKLFVKELLTYEQYWKIYDLMIGKYHPVGVAAYSFELPYDDLDDEQRKRFQDKVPKRPYRHYDFPKEDNAGENVEETTSSVDVPEKSPEPSEVADESQDGSHLFVADEIKKLKELLDCGALTQDEFEAQKKKLLNM